MSETADTLELEEHDDAILSIPRAAKFLGVSPTTMRELLDRRRIPFDVPSKQRKVHLRDLVEYQKRRHRKSRRQMVCEDLLAD